MLRVEKIGLLDENSTTGALLNMSPPLPVCSGPSEVDSFDENNSSCKMGINEKAEPEPTMFSDENSGNSVYQMDQFLMDALENPRDRLAILKLDHDLENFINDTRRIRLELPPMSSYNRLIAHRVADYFHLEHVAMEFEGGKRTVVLFKTNETKLPVLRFVDLVEQPDAPSLKTVKIMRRIETNSKFEYSVKSNDLQRNSATDPKAKESYSNEQNSSASSGVIGTSLIEEPSALETSSSSLSFSVGSRGSCVTSTSDRTLEEREEEYAKARARIFGISENPIATNVNDILVDGDGRSENSGPSLPTEVPLINSAAPLKDNNDLLASSFLLPPSAVVDPLPISFFTKDNSSVEAMVPLVQRQSFPAGKTSSSPENLPRRSTSKHSNIQNNNILNSCATNKSNNDYAMMSDRSGQSFAWNQMNANNPYDVNGSNAFFYTSSVATAESDPRVLYNVPYVQNPVPMLNSGIDCSDSGIYRDTVPFDTNATFTPEMDPVSQHRNESGLWTAPSFSSYYPPPNFENSSYPIPSMTNASYFNVPSADPLMYVFRPGAERTNDSFAWQIAEKSSSRGPTEPFPTFAQLPPQYAYWQPYFQQQSIQPHYDSTQYQWPPPTSAITGNRSHVTARKKSSRFPELFDPNSPTFVHQQNSMRVPIPASTNSNPEMSFPRSSSHDSFLSVASHGAESNSVRTTFQSPMRTVGTGDSFQSNRQLSGDLSIPISTNLANSSAKNAFSATLATIEKENNQHQLLQITGPTLLGHILEICNLFSSKLSKEKIPLVKNTRKDKASSRNTIGNRENGAFINFEEFLERVKDSGANVKSLDNGRFIAVYRNAAQASKAQEKLNAINPSLFLVRPWKIALTTVTPMNSSSMDNNGGSTSNLSNSVAALSLLEMPLSRKPETASLPSSEQLN